MSRRRRLLILSSTYPRWHGDHEPGFVHELARRLTPDFEVSVLCPHAAGAARRECLDGVEVTRYRYAPDALEVLVNNGGIASNLARSPWKMLLVPLFLASQAVALLRMLRWIRPDVLHAHWILPQGLLVAGLGALGIRVPPMVVTSHGADLFAFRSRAMRGIKRFVLHRADAITVVSEGMPAVAQGLAGRGKPVHVESMGVDLEGRFHPEPGSARSSSEVLFVGRLVEKKGLDVLLAAFAAVRARRPDATLTVAGFGPDLDARRRQADVLGIAHAVDFVGAVTQESLPALYRRAAVLAAPFVEASSGDQEGLGLVMVEALGCACPVVASDLPATRTLGDACPALTLVPPRDAAALAEALLRILQGGRPLDFSGIAGFDWAARAPAYAGLLADTASGTERRSNA